MEKVNRELGLELEAEVNPDMEKLGDRRRCEGDVRAAGTWFSWVIKRLGSYKSRFRDQIR